MNHDTHYNCKLQYDTVRFCTSSDNISLIKGKENLFKHTFDIETLSEICILNIKFHWKRRHIETFTEKNHSY